MKLRTLLAWGLILAAIAPAATFGWWTYKHGVEREFAEVKDRHLLLAQNLGTAMARYHKDLVAGTDTVATYLAQGTRPHNLHGLMRSLNILCVHLLDAKTKTVLAKVDHRLRQTKHMPPNHVYWGLDNAVSGRATFSPVMQGRNGTNVMLVARRYGDTVSIAVVSTQYFVDLGSAIAFGEKGHAAIVDHKGNVLSHPLPSWVAARKNIAKVSAVKRMMNRETGIQQFYSPALKGDMIAGFTHVPGPNWGVMIPQPVVELHAKALENTKALIWSFAFGLALSIAFILLFVNSLAKPIEHFLGKLREHTTKRRLEPVETRRGIVHIAEVQEFFSHYNDLVSEVRGVHTMVEKAAYTDGLTALPNRTHLVELTSNLLRSARAAEQKSTSPSRGSVDTAKGAFIFIDLDDFKQVNDVHGHAAGDQLLQNIANALRTVVETQWRGMGFSMGDPIVPVVARVGGDEFAITFPGLNNKTALEAFLRHLQKALEQASVDVPGIGKRHASIGASRYPKDGCRLRPLMRLADIAMYHAKKQGKGRFYVYDDSIGVLSVSQMRAEIETAIANDELTLEYQPKVCCRTRMIRSVEALVRWDHPEKGRIAPNEWLPAITNSPLMQNLGEWVADRAMRDHAKWTASGLDLNVAINVGSEHFTQPNMVKRICAIARKNRFNPADMELEITESTAFSNEALTDTVIEGLHRAGFKIAIDDFGTGYSNIARLAKLPVDSLKVDRSVINNALTDDRVAGLLQCVLTMAKALGCKTVAEGIETEEHIDLCRQQGVHILQGFYFSRSLASDDLENWVQANQPEHDPATTVLTPLAKQNKQKEAA
ncbi:MAG: EAL domain-containing protein [Pseudomonadota bacterium]